MKIHTSRAAIWARHTLGIRQVTGIRNRGPAFTAGGRRHGRVDPRGFIGCFRGFCVTALPITDPRNELEYRESAGGWGGDHAGRG